MQCRFRPPSSTPKPHLRVLSTSAAAEIAPVDLAFDLHVSDKCKANPDACKPPIVFLHGLFGSKANNRTISKYRSQRSPSRFTCRGR
jgi:pimeloyl-ACP methyl ester carboxylesterase